MTFPIKVEQGHYITIWYQSSKQQIGTTNFKKRIKCFCHWHGTSTPPCRKNNSNKNKMVNHGNSDDDDNNRNEEIKNNNKKITLAQSYQQIQKSNVVGLLNDTVSLVNVANIKQVFAKKLLHRSKNSKK